MTHPSSVPAEVLATLRGAVRGDVLLPGDDGYDAARAVWNGRFESRPDVVVRCRGVEDVQAAVRFAQDQGLALTVKSGGHDYAGRSAARGGLLVDLGRMSSVTVDAEGRVATVGAGATWAEVDRATQAVGLATVGGTVSHVGVAGFVLGGGLGWLSRKHGTAADNLLAAEVVTADGERVRASSSENPDLFWALRGGGGNFGVVTSLELALHEVGPEVTAGQVMYPLSRAKELLGFYRDYSRQAPDEVMCFPFLLRIPPLDAFPEALHGEVVLDFVVCHAGPLEEGEAALAPFRTLGEPILDAVGPVPYADFQQTFDAGMGSGFRWYSRAHYFDTLTDEAIDALLDNLHPFPGAFTTVYLGMEGGALGREEEDAVAYPNRSAAHSLHIFPGWIEPGDDEEIMAWTRSLYEATSAHGNDRVYVNMLGEDEEARVRAAYGANYDRLARIKRAWDPDNLFRRNHNIRPGES